MLSECSVGIRERARLFPSLLVALALLPASARAGEPNAAPAGPTWQALRESIAERGLDASLVYDGATLANLRGGAQIGARYLGVLRMQLSVDAQRLLGWSGASLFASVLQTHGGHPSGLVGDAQGVSNLEAPAGAQLYELWLQQSLFGNRLSVLAGRYDLNTEFYRLQSAGLFLNSSFGMGPELSQSGRLGASVYPDTSVGLRLAFKPARGVVVRAAVLDGVPVKRPDGQRLFAEGDGLFFVSEQAFLWRPRPVDSNSHHRLRIGRNSGLPPYEHKLAWGAWCYTGRFADLSQRTPDGSAALHLGSAGAYLLADARLHRSTSRSPEQVNAFAQLGVGDFRVDRFGFYVGAGIVVSGLLPGLENDELGLALALARSGSHYLELQRQAGMGFRAIEASIEASYLFQFGQHLALQPDFQYVRSPGGDPALDDAVVFTLRFELAS